MTTRKQRNNPAPLVFGLIAALAASGVGIALLSRKKAAPVPGGGGDGPGPIVDPVDPFDPREDGLVPQAVVEQLARDNGFRPFFLEQVDVPIARAAPAPAPAVVGPAEDTLTRFDPGSGLVIPGSLQPEEQEEEGGSFFESFLNPFRL